RAHSRILEGRDATTAQLSAAFDDLEGALREREVGNRDMAIIMIESHLLSNSQGVYIAGTDTRLRGVPSPALSVTRVSETLEQVTSYGCRVILLLDLVHEGTPFAPRDGLKQWVRDFQRQRRVIVALASREGPSLRTNRHGLFAESILDALTFNQDPQWL